MRKNLEKIICFFFGHKWEYQYRKISEAPKSEHHILKCQYCEKYKQVKKSNK